MSGYNQKSPTVTSSGSSPMLQRNSYSLSIFLKENEGDDDNNYITDFTSLKYINTLYIVM